MEGSGHVWGEQLRVEIREFRAQGLGVCALWVRGFSLVVTLCLEAFGLA